MSVEDLGIKIIAGILIFSAINIIVIALYVFVFAILPARQQEIEMKHYQSTIAPAHYLAAYR